MQKIWVTFQRAGIHSFPLAGIDAELKSSSYLAHPHRHLFKMKVSIQVFHEDRELEFHIFLRWLESLYTESQLSLDNASCEMIALDLADKIKKQYPNRWFSIDVSEDGECGALLEFSA